MALKNPSDPQDGGREGPREIISVGGVWGRVENFTFTWFNCFRCETQGRTEKAKLVFSPSPFLWVLVPLPRLKCKRRFCENVHLTGRGGCDHKEEGGNGGGAARQADGMLER